MNIFELLKKDITSITNNVFNLQNNSTILKQFNVSYPKHETHGDIATNIAMIISSQTKNNVINIAERLKSALIKLNYIEQINITKQGFINFIIKKEIWYHYIQMILNNDPDFLQVNIGHNQSLNIEYVSANVTGPLHIGHTRAAVYGSTLANILKKCGYQITTEYYINDMGQQIDNLIKSVIIRYKEIVTQTQIPIPKGLYPGSYLITIANKICSKFGDRLLTNQNINSIVKELTINEIIKGIKTDLIELGVHHDVFFSEESLHNSKQIENTLILLKSMNMVYEGYISQPKGYLNEEWKRDKLLLFKSTNFGDDQDRCVQKTDKSWSYLAADIAYAKNKIDRGFDKLIYILGADHNGYIKRIQGAIKLLSNERVTCDFKICQIVNLMQDGKQLKMSKRTGDMITLRYVLDLVGKNAIRYMMLTKKNDTHIDFDIKEILKHSSDNPIFYIEYAYIRTVSIIKNAIKYEYSAYKNLLEKKINFTLLSSNEEIHLMKLLISWPQILESAALHCEPHRVATYTLNIASQFHMLWNLGKNNNDYRFLINNNIELTTARLALVQSVQNVMKYTFDTMGLDYPNSM